VSDTGWLPIRPSSATSSFIAPSVTSVRTSVVETMTPGNIEPLNELDTPYVYPLSSRRLTNSREAGLPPRMWFMTSIAK